ncbi:MAG: Mu transposase C-terminal domain-containing protein [Cyanobacteria bacterium P01_G01_bin.67]
MPRITLKEGVRFELHSREYKIIECVSPGEWKIIDVVTGRQSSLSEDVITNFLFKGELSFINAAHQSHIAFPDLNEKKKNDAIWREKYVTAVLDEGIQQFSQRNVEPIIREVYCKIQVADNLVQEVKDKPQPSFISVYRWLKKYKQSEEDIHSLVSNVSKKGNRKSRLAPEVRSIIQQAIEEIYLSRNQGSVKDTYDRVIVLIVEENRYRQSLNLPELKIPSYVTIGQIIKKIPSHERDRARLGKRTADLIHRPVSIGQGASPTRPLEVVEIDHSLLPFYVLDNEYRLPVGLPWLTSAVDLYSQTVIGYYLTFDTPTYLSVMYCLLHSIRSKEYVKSEYRRVKNDWNSYGLIETLKVDNGLDFKGKSLEDACRELKITLEFCPVRMPWYKGTVERFFGGIQQQLGGHIPGNCGKFLESNDYDPKKQAVVTLQELQEIIHLFLIDIHNQSTHTKLKSTRASVWHHGVQSYPVSLPSSDDNLKVLLGDIDERTIQREGIVLEYIYYNSDHLQALRDRYEATDLRRSNNRKGKEKAKFKYNRNDLSVIYVFDPQTREYLAIPAVNQLYTQGLSLYQHRIICKYASEHGFIKGGSKIDVVALALAKEQIQEIVREAIKKTKAAKTSKQVIRYLGTGRGEDVIAAQERAVEAIKSTKTTRAIATKAESVPSNINSGISDFASAVELDLKAEEVAVEIASENLIGSKSKTKTSRTAKKSQPKAKKKSAAKKSKSRQTTKTDSTTNKKQKSSLDLQQQTQKKTAQESLSKKEKSQSKDERDSRGSIGLPQWKPPSR